jgi:hypothetical protein
VNALPKVAASGQPKTAAKNFNFYSREIMQQNNKFLVGLKKY